MPTTAKNAPNLDGLNAQLRSGLDQLVAAVKAQGGNPTITSGYRTTEQQAQLYNSGNGGVPVAKPGSSLHEKGLAADVAGDQKTTQLLHQLAPQFGLTFPLSNDPVHVQLAGGSNQAGGNQTAGGPMPLKDRLNGLAAMFGTGAVSSVSGNSTTAGTNTTTAGMPSTGSTTPATGPSPLTTTQPTGATTQVTAEGGDPSKDHAANQQLGKTLASGFGWGDGDSWTALNNIVMHESGWNATAANPTSSARGIGQNIHGYSNDYQEGNAQQQIQWTLNYIKQRYGTPQAAWQHWQQNNWY